MVTNPVMTYQWLMLTVMGTLYFVTGGLIEERRLATEFGETYRHYQERVPFIIPNPDEPEPNIFLSCYNYSQLQHGGMSCYSLKNTAKAFLV